MWRESRIERHYPAKKRMGRPAKIVEKGKPEALRT